MVCAQGGHHIWIPLPSWLHYKWYILQNHLDSLNILLDDKFTKSMLIKFGLCKNIEEVTFPDVIEILEIVYKKFASCVDEYRALHRRREIKAIKYKKAQSLLRLIYKARFAINNAHGKYQLYEQIEEKRLEELRRSNIVTRTPRENSDSVFTRLAGMSAQRMHSDELTSLHIKGGSQTEDVSPKSVEKFIGRCMNRYLPKKPIIGGLMDIKRPQTGKKTLIIDKKVENKKLMLKSLKILEQSAYHNDPQIRGYVNRLIKDFRKDCKT